MDIKKISIEKLTNGPGINMANEEETIIQAYAYTVIPMSSDPAEMPMCIGFVRQYSFEGADKIPDDFLKQLSDDLTSILNEPETTDG